MTTRQFMGSWLACVAFTCAMLCVVGCYSPPQPQYEVIQSPAGVQQVVVTDNSGTQFLMDMLLFNQLMSSGGYVSVNNYYHVHRASYPVYVRSNYSTWRSVDRGSYNNYRSSNYNPSTRSYVPSSGGGSGYKPTTPTSSGYKPSPPARSYTPPSSGYKPSSSGSSYKPSGSSGYKPSSSSSSYRPSSSSGYKRH